MAPSPITFTDQELTELKQDLEGLIPGHNLFRPRLAYGFADRNLRYMYMDAFF